MTRSSPVAAVRRLSKSYRSGVCALEALDVEFPSGRVTAILGPNGSGKSTLLRILAGRLVPTAGDVLLLGLDRTPSSRALRARVEYAPQGTALDPEMTGENTLRFFAALHGLSRSQARARTEELAEELGFSAHLSRNVSSYSGGLRKRLQAALSLLYPPDLFLLDEPTAGIDPEGRKILWRRLREQTRSGRTVLIVTQDLEEAEANADHVVLLDRGRLLAEGAPGDLIAIHGHDRVEITLREPVPNASRLQETLRPLGAIESIEVRDHDVSIVGRGLARPTERLLAHLESGGVAIVGFRFREPDLASVYFHLTGRPALKR